VVSSTPQPHFTPWERPRYPLYRRLGGPQGRSGQVRKISPPRGFQYPECPARSQSLYRLSYLAHTHYKMYCNVMNTSFTFCLVTFYSSFKNCVWHETDSRQQMMVGQHTVWGKKHRLNLTFRGSCIVIYSYNKSQQDALLLKFIVVRNSTCFRQIYCPSSGFLIQYS
jgi:hypothetical protein